MPLGEGSGKRRHWKGLGVSKGGAEEADGIWGHIAGLGTKGSMLALKETF